MENLVCTMHHPLKIVFLLVVGILPYCWEDSETGRCAELAFNSTGDVSLDYIAEMEELASSAHSAALNEQASFMLNSPEGACPYAGRKND